MSANKAQAYVHDEDAWLYLTMEKITLTLTLDETNLILKALGEQPFNSVYELIGKIQQQATGQLQESGSPATQLPPQDKPAPSI